MYKEKRHTIDNSRRTLSPSVDKVYRENHAENYIKHNFVTMSQEIFQRTDMSIGAKAALATVMGFEDGWNIGVRDISNRLGCGKNKTYAIFNELIDAGYLERFPIRKKNGKGQFEEFYYVVRDIAVQTMGMKKPLLEQNIKRPFNKSQVVECSPVPKKRELVNTNDQSVEYLEFDEKSSEVFSEIIQVVECSPLPCSSIVNNSRVNNSDAYKITNNIKEQDIKKQQQLNTKSKPKKIAAAVSSKIILKDRNLIIGEILSDLQRDYVIQEMLKIGKYDIEILDEIFCSLLDKKDFTKCENNFIKKLNAILNVIKEGKWTSPASLVLSKQKKDDKIESDRKIKLMNLDSELQAIKRSKEYFKQKDKKMFDFWCKEEVKIIGTIENYS